MTLGEQAGPRPRSSLHLFLAFSRLSLMGFGGVLPIAQRELVERLGWLSVEEFAELLSIGQVLPGPNVVNLSLMVGDRYFGLRGALAALAGMLLLPLVLVLVAAALYQQFAAHPAVAGAVRGMGAVSAGLVMAIALKLLPALRRNPLGRTRWIPVTVAVALATGWWRWPLVLVIGLVGGVSCAMAWHRLSPRADAASQETAP
ncbi:chromate transporter [Ideonella oryzae]|uniref:Chromate transporter n=1 Tax=Ideonella oryzae TaxID=2937441 RepID=A0ABT1BQ08_9BURK|nr:chromate transporter [Ideonella oryzae]MCO5978004.1 chromate transporter [Ideonella oryzae]